jgi:hypothetical protein
VDGADRIEAVTSSASRTPSCLILRRLQHKMATEKRARSRKSLWP